MAFSSFVFILVLLPLTALGYHALRGRPSAGMLWLLAASLGFYAWGRPTQLVWLIGSIGFNHLVDRGLDATDAARRKRILMTGLVGNIVFLATLKYTNFLLSSLFPLWGGTPPSLDLVFPLGVSFFTLQQIMYLVDRYEGLATRNSLLEHATFVSLFATITSGPITRTKQLLPQLRAGAGASDEQTTRALGLFALGLFKKIVIADSFGQLVGGTSTAEAWISSFAYSFRIYFDFSGYSDMAVAAGLFLGLTIPENFAAPYRSRSVIEFWQRWHITLSTFITTYLYTPLVRSTRRVTLARASVATLTAMTIAGLWHGPSWAFVAFGMFHGLGLVINQLWRKKIKIKIPPFIGLPATFLFVNTGFVLFRATDLTEALHTFRHMLSRHPTLGLDSLRSTFSTSGQAAMIALPVAVGLIAALFGPTSHQLVDAIQPRPRHVLALVSLTLISFLFLNSSIAKEFIYRAF